MRRLATILAVASCTVYAAGCGGPMCGVIPQPSILTDGGYVGFSAPVGGSITTAIPVQDSAPVNETITGSSFTGADAAAFKVLSTFPMPLPAATALTVSVQFTPQHTGSSTATLVLETENMGPSPIQLQGSTY